MTLILSQITNFYSHLIKFSDQHCYKLCIGMTADTFHFVGWNVYCDTCDSTSETKNTHTHRRICVQRYTHRWYMWLPKRSEN